MRRNLRTGYLVWITLFYLVISPQLTVYLNCTSDVFTNVTEAQAQLTKDEQSTEFYPLESTPGEGADPLEGPLHVLLREELQLEGQALEGPVDPETYMLGPGDLLAVYVMGEASDEMLGRIAADGMLRMRSIGIFDTRDKTFAVIQEEILETASTRYNADDIIISLVELRNFKTSVGGMVWAPGTYNMTAADRVVSLLARAGGFYNPTRRDQEEELTELQKIRERQKEEDIIPVLPSYSARRAQIIHTDGTTEKVDLLRFLRAGQYEGNPHLRDGDFLLVPPLNPKSGVLGIFGAVNHQGLLEYLEGDDLETIILLAGGMTNSALKDSIEITRFVGEQAEFETFFVSVNDPAQLTLPIYPDDRVYIRSIPNYHPQHQVELRGEFMKPGFYPVMNQGTPIIDIINQAGGFKPLASLAEATLTRKLGIELVDMEYERLRLTPVSEMNPLEYQYYKNKSRERSGQVVVNLYDLIFEGDSTQNVLLRDGDILQVPPMTKAIKVMGQVKHPGIITFRSGEAYTYYIDKSGGFSWNASKSKIRVIKASSGKWLKPQKTIIEEGDTIFIPEKADLDYWKIYKDLMLVLTQFATLYLLVITINTK